MRNIPHFLPPEATAEVTYLSERGEAKAFLQNPGEIITLEIHQTSHFFVDSIVISGVVESYEWKFENGFVQETIRIRLNSNTRVENEVPGIQITQSKIDTKYPHVCFKCKKTLRFAELCAANMSQDKDYLKKLWKLEGIEFYCCTCFKHAKN